MKAVILAGGFGTRLSEETAIKPKPMVEIGGKPILWHILKIYSSYGISDFIICCGYKGEVIKKYFFEYHLMNSDWSINLSTNSLEITSNEIEDWKITLVDTGFDTQTGGRLKRVDNYLAGETEFLMTYGDGVGDVNIKELIEFHRLHNPLATMTVVQTVPRYGLVKSDGNYVNSFMEKPKNTGECISAGFFVLSSRIFDFIDGDQSIFEVDVLPKLTADRQLMCRFHNSFWKPMDTLKDRYDLEELWQKNEAPWKTW